MVAITERDYEVWLEILNVLFLCNKLTLEDYYFMKGYFTAVLKPNPCSISPLEILYSRLIGEKNDKK